MATFVSVAQYPTKYCADDNNSIQLFIYHSDIL